MRSNASLLTPSRLPLYSASVDHDEAVEAIKHGAQDTAVAAIDTALSMPVVGLLRDLLKLGLGPSSDDRFRDAVSAEIADAALRRLPQVEAAVAELLRAGAGVNASDFRRVLEHFARAWTTAADAKKRRLLEDAFTKSFDPELYESGLLNVLWARMERLSYGDLRLLRDLAEIKEYQLLERRHRLAQQTSIGAFHLSNLEDEGLTRGTSPTDLGKRLCQLAWNVCAEPNVESTQP